MNYETARRTARAWVLERPDIGQSVIMAALIEELDARAVRIEELEHDLAAERAARQELEEEVRT